MFSALRNWFAPPKIEWIVDHGQAPRLPSGAKRILRHNCVAEGARTMAPGDLELVEFRPGTTYEEFYLANENKPLCDVIFLDSLTKLMVPDADTADRMRVDQVLEKYFPGFRGQIFFLGTEFESNDGRPCVPYLNIRTHQPAIRYLCPSAHPINHNMVCTAALLRSGTGK